MEVQSQPQEQVSQSSTDTSKEQAQAPTSPSDNSSSPAAPASAPEQYTPNYTFRHRDKEHEMDEFVRSAIKDKASEEKMRDLYTKAFGLDALKPKFDSFRGEYDKIKSDHESLTSQLGILDGYLNQGNLDEFFKTLKISEQQVYQYVLDKLNYQDLPKDQQQRMDQFRQAQRDSLMLDRQNQDLYSKFEQTSVQLRELQLDSVMNRPDIKSIVDAFDSRRKESSPSFRERVIMEGQSVFNATGEDLSPEEAVRRVVNLLDFQAASPQPQSPVVAPQAHSKPPVIPNIAGKGTSPAKKVPKSLKDLEKIRQSLEA